MPAEQFRPNLLAARFPAKPLALSRGTGQCIRAKRDKVPGQINNRSTTASQFACGAGCGEVDVPTARLTGEMRLISRGAPTELGERHTVAPVWHDLIG
jgi:hypothetical protein